MNESIPKNVRYRTQIYPRAVVVAVVVIVVPPRPRAVLTPRVIAFPCNNISELVGAALRASRSPHGFEHPRLAVPSSRRARARAA